LNTLSDLSVVIKANEEPLGSCKARLLSGNIASCPPVAEGYIDCSNQPDRHSVKLQNDGVYTLCLWGLDKVGNVSMNASKVSWTRDTTATPLAFSGLPPKFSNAKNISVPVSAGETGTYQYILLEGNECNITKLNAAAPRAMTQPISEALPVADGPLTLCARFTDQLGNRQRPPTSYSWIKQTTPPIASITMGLPLSPSPATSATVQIEGTNVASYQFALLKSIDSTCQTGLTYGPWTTISTKATLAINPPSDGFMTLCVLGKDESGNIQTTPSIYRWLRIAASPANPPNNLFASITRSSRARSSQTLVFTRNGSNLPKESMTARVCSVTSQNGTLGKCISRPVTFATGTPSANATFTGLSTGKWVGVLLQKDGTRGRAEPLVFDF
jgi:hypothetical protein